MKVRWEVIEPVCKRNMDETKTPLGGALKINIVRITTDRMCVPGGWLVRTLAHDKDSRVSVSMVFVADPGNSWNLS
jgi:hypothetical protein